MAGSARRRYWARSLIGWRRFRQARPNDAHRALARLEARGRTRSSSPRTSTGCIRRPAARGDRPAWAARPRALHGLRTSGRRARSAQDGLGRLNAGWLALDAPMRPTATPTRRRRFRGLCVAILPPLRRPAQARRRVLRRERARATGSKLAAAPRRRRRDADRRLLADGLFRLPLRASRGPGKADRRDQPRADAGGRTAGAEGGGGMRGGAGVSAVMIEPRRVRLDPASLTHTGSIDSV